MQAGISVDILGIDISSKLNQRLNVLDMHLYARKVKGCGIFAIRVLDTDIVAPREDEDTEDTLVALRSTMHHSLVIHCLLIGIAFKVKHQRLNHVSITSSCRQMNGLRPHMGISMLCHMPLRHLIVCKFVSHLI